MAGRTAIGPRGMHRRPELELLVVAASAGIAALGTTLNWISGYAWSERGVQSVYGGLSLFAATGILAACAYGIAHRLRAVWFPPILGALGSVVAAMPVVVILTQLGLHDDRSTSHGLHSVDPQFGLFLTLGGGLGCVFLSLMMTTAARLRSRS
jgi:hypothetical protein